VAPDLLGHAGSEVPEAPVPFSEQAALVAELPAALGLSRPALLGYSFGGRLALGALLAAPERFRAAVLIGATAGIRAPAQRAARAAADAERAARIEAIGVERFLAEWQQVPIIATQARINAEHRARMACERARHSARGLADSLRGAGTGSMPSLWERLGELNLPVLLVTGAEDAKFAAIASELRAALPQAEHVVVASAGHCAHLEAPVRAARAIADFLAQSTRGS